MARPLVYPSLVSTLVAPTVAEREKREQLLFPTYTSVHPPSIILHLIAPIHTREPESPPTPAYGTAYVAIRAAGAGSSLTTYVTS
jgi:hypothetical protein